MGGRGASTRGGAGAWPRVRSLTGAVAAGGTPGTAPPYPAAPGRWELPPIRRGDHARGQADASRRRCPRGRSRTACTATSRVALPVL